MADRSRIMKWVLFAFTVVFWTISGLMMGVGFYSVTQKNDYSEFTSTATDPGAVLVAVGFIIFFVSFVGTIGALRENTTLLRIYEVFIIIVLILQFIGGILGFAFWPEVKEGLDTQIKKMITKYRDDSDLRNTIDYVQERLECCGSLNIHDWDLNRYFHCYQRDPRPIEYCSVPYSCCVIKEKQRINYQCGYQMRTGKSHRLDVKKYIYTRGCLNVLELYFEDNLVLIGAVAIAFLLPEIIGIVLTHLFIDNIKDRIDKMYETDGLENRPPRPAGPSRDTDYL